jgi:transposase
MGKEEKYSVRLQTGQREWLKGIISESVASIAVLKRARVLLQADSSPEGPGSSDERIAAELKVGVATVHRVRQRFAELGLAAAVARKAAEGRQYRKLTKKQEDRLVALAQGPVPEGHDRWSLRLLAKHFIALGFVDSISRECVRATLNKRNVTLT